MSKKLKETLRRQRLQVMAELAARYAGEEEFHSRRGCYPLECNEQDGYDDGTVLCIYDNNPYSAGPQYREEQLCRFRQRLDQRGYKEVGFGIWPPEGEESAGYTFALLIDDWTPEMQEEVSKMYQEVVGQIVAKLVKLMSLQK
jgi:hypothetical protein